MPEEDWPAAFALWIAEVTRGSVPRFRRRTGGRSFGRKLSVESPGKHAWLSYSVEMKTFLTSE